MDELSSMDEVKIRIPDLHVFWKIESVYYLKH